jgi:hypothetical protein
MNVQIFETGAVKLLNVIHIWMKRVSHKRNNVIVLASSKYFNNFGVMLG